jgi:hypothetical protein
MVRTCDMAMADALVEAVARGFRSYDDFAAYLDSIGTTWDPTYDFDDEPVGCPICDGVHGYHCPVESKAAARAASCAR